MPAGIQAIAGFLILTTKTAILTTKEGLLTTKSQLLLQHYYT